MTHLKTKFNAYWLLMRADKPIGIYLLLWPTIWALLLAADGLPELPVLMVFVLGVVIMRSAGCVINDYADRHVDGSVERTVNRPLVNGLVTEKEALGLFFVLLFLAFMLVLTLNWQTIALSVVAAGLAALYPFMKRYTHLPQVVLGAAFSWAIPMAFMAINLAVPWWAWLLFISNLVWTVAYDTEYAMVDRDDDICIGVKSTAILFGQFDKLIIGLLQMTTLLGLTALAYLVDLTWPFYLSIAVSSLLFVYQQQLIRAREKTNCFKAFLNNHYVGMVLTLGLAGHYFIT
jgi:4-hydroxybenzoate polyprenyltransferase